jgi:cytochrome b561
MAMKNSTDRYGRVSRIIHWLMALCIIGLLCLGIWMDEIPEDASYRMDVYMLHKSTGFLMLILVAVRVAWLAYTPAPALPDAISARDKRLTKAAKHVFYMLMMAVPLSGLLMSNYFGHPVDFYTLVKVPLLVEKSKELGGVFHELHEVFAFILIGVLVLHIAGVIKHRRSDNPEEDVFPRMWGKK